MNKGLMQLFIVFVLLSLIVQPAAAGTDFSLVNGIVDTSNGGMSLAVLNFWKNLRIDFNGQAPESQDILATGEGYFAEGGLVNTASGELKGTYHAQSGYFQGTFFIDDVLQDSDLGTNSVSRYEGKFSVYLNPGEDPAIILFKGTQINDLTIGDYTSRTTTPREFNVTFSVEGGVSLIQPTPTMTFPDSGARFSDLSGQVEIMRPCGLKPNGDYDYCDEIWDWAELDTILSEGTMIRTDRNSTAILSFADMTTFIQKPETIIYLAKPAERDSQFKLLAGNLWVNVKKMLKDGSMDIEMSQAVAGIKGTTFVLEDDGTTSTLKVIEGTVEFTALASGETQSVSAGSMLSADARGLGEQQAFDVTAESAAWPQEEAGPSDGAISATAEPNIVVLPYGAEDPAEPTVVVLPYGAEAPAVSADAPDSAGSRIGRGIILYFMIAILVFSTVVVVALLARRKRRQ